MNLIGKVIAGVFPGLKKETPDTGPISPNNPILKRIFGWGTDSDTLRNPYAQLPIIYAAIRAVEKVFAQTPWKLFRGEVEVSPNDPVAQLLARPNLTQSPDDVRVAIATNIQMRGNAFIVKSEEERNGLPLALYAWPSKYFTPHITDSGIFIGWWMKRGKADKIALPPERVIHIPTFNPDDELMGLAPLDVLKQSYSALWEAVVYNRKFFRNDGTPSMVYKSKTLLSPREKEQFEKMLKDRRGLDKAHTSQLLEGDIDATIVGFSQKDMQFLELVKYFGDDALMVFGVPKAQVSKYEDVNYATALAQDKTFITSTCIPLMRKVEGKINAQWLGAMGYTLKFDERANPSLTYIAHEEAEKVVALTGGPVMTLNEGRHQLGLEPVPGGDEPPIQSTPDASFPPKAAEPVKVEKTEKEEKADAILAEEMEKARRTNTWHGLNAKISPQVKRAEQDVRGYYRSIEVRALALARKKYLPEMTKAVDPADVDALFDDAKLERLVEKHLKASLITGGGTLDVAINLEAPEILEYLGSRVQYMKGVNVDAREKLRETISRVLREGVEQSRTEEQAAEALREALKIDFNAFKGRARMIARTEVHSAFSDGRYEGAKELSPEKIEWISSRDSFVRDAHRKLDGKTVPFGETFAKWGFNGTRPLDPAAGAAQVIACRCNFALKF
jgi:HK97 family phage portal protein